MFTLGGLDTFEPDVLLEFVEQKYGHEKRKKFSILIDINKKLSEEGENLFSINE